MMQESNPSAAAGEPETPTPSADSVLLEAEVLELRAQLEACRQESLRVLADVENQRKRIARDAEQARRYATERLLSDLLPVADAMEAGLRSGGEDPARLREGIELTHRQFVKALEAHGLSILDPAGERFDPESHQAMGMVDAPGQEPGTVVAVLQKGYRLHDRLVRPALVQVARDPGE
jgi:molecular chaperone GrpE